LFKATAINLELYIKVVLLLIMSKAGLRSMEPL